MFSRVLQAYEQEGYRIDLGTPARLYSELVDSRGRRTLVCSGGFTVSDAFLFAALAQIMKPKDAFIIGNSFGLSTFVLADLFPATNIDVIDAEAEGLDVGIGSELTRRIAATHYPRVTLTIGYSPQDVPIATRAKSYQLIFVDGLHTNEQLLLDFDAVGPYCDESCVIVFHDVACCRMQTAWNKILPKAKKLGFKDYTLGFTQMGCAALIRGLPEVDKYFALAGNDFEGPYQIGFTAENAIVRAHRPFFWDFSFGYLERLIRRKIRRWLGREKRSPVTP